MSVEYVDTGNKYNYPNINTYRSMGRHAAGLSHGFIYSLSNDGSMKYYKKFQFNPPAVEMAIGFVNTDPVQSTLQGGALASTSGVGAMSTRFELMFNREPEVFLAQAQYDGTNAGRAGNFDDNAATIFRLIGVQKDIYDLFRVILSGVDDASQDVAIPTDMTMSAMSRKAYDLSADGRLLQGKPVGVVFGNDSAGGGDANLAWYGFINGFSLSFTKFNKFLVPTMAQVSINLDVLQQRPQSTIGQSTSTAGSAQTDLPGFNTPANNVTPWLAPNSPGTVATSTASPLNGTVTTTNAYGRQVPA